MPRPKQYPPTWDPGQIGDKAPPLEVRKRRDHAVGWNKHYEYAVGINWIQLSGKVTRDPRIASKHGTTVLFRLAVPNQDNPRQWFFVTVRVRGALATWTYANVTRGDIVMVVGRIWTGTRPMKFGENGEVVETQSFPVVTAERISSSYPVQVDNDTRFVRVRRDLWERAGEFLREIDLTDVPKAKRKQLLDEFAQIAQVDDDVTTEVLRDPEPTDPKPQDFPPCAP